LRPGGMNPYQLTVSTDEWPHSFREGL
jgi:hypothetical protein